MWGMMDGYGWAGWGIAQMLLWWVLIILGIVMLVRWLARPVPNAQHAPSETALEVLKKRYVRGEIGQEEFEQKKRDIAG